MPAVLGILLVCILITAFTALLQRIRGHKDLNNLGLDFLAGCPPVERSAIIEIIGRSIANGTMLQNILIGNFCKKTND